MATPCVGVTDLWSLTEVTCNYADFKVKVPKCVFDETLFDGSPLTELLKDDLFISGSARPGTKCHGKIDDADKFVYFDVGQNPKTCEVRRQPKTYTNRPNHNKVLEYSANIQYSIGSSNSVISRTRSINLPFFCHFPLDFKVSEDTKLKAKRQEIRYKVKGEVVTTEIVSGLFKDETWDTQLTGDQVFEVPTPIHVGFSTPNDSDKFKIKLKKCWATPESNPNHDTKYVFLDDWCGKKAELDGKTLEVYNLEHAAGFAIEAFTWKDQTCSDIFLHCEIELCLTGQDCDTAPSCPKDRKRREVEEKKTVVGGNKVRVCGDATFPLKEKKFTCPKELELKFPSKSEAEGIYEWVGDEKEYRKKDSRWAIFKKQTGATTDWIVREGTGEFYQATGDCPVNDDYLDIAKKVKAQGFEVIEKKKTVCPTELELKYPSNAAAEGTYTLDSRDGKYYKAGSKWKLVKAPSFWSVVDDNKIMYTVVSDCPVGDQFRDAKYGKLLAEFEIAAKEAKKEEEKKDEKKKCPLEVEIKFPDHPGGIEGVYVAHGETGVYERSGSGWSIKSRMGHILIYKDGRQQYFAKGNCPVGLVYTNSDSQVVPPLKVTAKEEKKEEEKKTCPEKVDVKWPKSGNPDIEGTYTLDTSDKSYRKPNSNWVFKPDGVDFVVYKAEVEMFWIESNCPVSDAYKDNENSPVTGLEVTEHKEEKKEEKVECPQKVTVSFETEFPGSQVFVGEYVFNSDNGAYTNDRSQIKKNKNNVWQLGRLGIDDAFSPMGVETKTAAACPSVADWIKTDGPPSSETIKVVAAEEEKKKEEKCPEKVTVSFGKHYEQFFALFSGDYVLNSEGDTYQIHTKSNSYLKKNKDKNVWQLVSKNIAGVFVSFGVEHKDPAACPTETEWIKTGGPLGLETIKVVATKEKKKCPSKLKVSLKSSDPQMEGSYPGTYRWDEGNQRYKGSQVDIILEDGQWKFDNGGRIEYYANVAESTCPDGAVFYSQTSKQKEEIFDIQAVAEK